MRFYHYAVFVWSCLQVFTLSVCTEMQKCTRTKRPRKNSCPRKKFLSLKKKKDRNKQKCVKKGEVGRRGEEEARTPGLIHIVKPVDEIEKGKNGGEYYPWPSIDGVDVRKIWDFDFQLWRASAQPSLFGLRVSLQAVPPRPARLPVLDPWVIQHHRGGVSGIADAGGDLVPGHFVMDLQRGQQDVPLRVHLRGGKSRISTAALTFRLNDLRRSCESIIEIFFFPPANKTHYSSPYK